MTDRLNEHFPNKQIGHSGTIDWPARSPDLTTMIFVCDFVKERVYARKSVTVQKLETLIMEDVERYAGVFVREMSCVFIMVVASLNNF